MSEFVSPPVSAEVAEIQAERDIAIAEIQAETTIAVAEENTVTEEIRSDNSWQNEIETMRMRLSEMRASMEAMAEAQLQTRALLTETILSIQSPPLVETEPEQTPPPETKPEEKSAEGALPEAKTEEKPKKREAQKPRRRWL